jgi:hypothetical protein
MAAQTRTITLAPYGKAGALRDAWPEFGIDKRRAILRTVIDHITVGPARKSGRTFDPDRIDVTWIV